MVLKPFKILQSFQQQSVSVLPINRLASFASVNPYIYCCPQALVTREGLSEMYERIIRVFMTAKHCLNMTERLLSITQTWDKYNI